MNERQMQFRVGVVVFATMIIGGVLATLNGPLPTGWLPWGRRRTRSAFELPQAPGVGPNTPVRKNGTLDRPRRVDRRSGRRRRRAGRHRRRPAAVDRTTCRTSARPCWAMRRSISSPRPAPPGRSRSPDGAIIPRRGRSAIRSMRSPNWATCRTTSQRRASRSATPATKWPIWPDASTKRSATKRRKAASSGCWTPPNARWTSSPTR